jgi:hypothetical protein
MSLRIRIKLKIGIIIWGALLIVGAMVDQVIMPNMILSVNDLTDSIQRNVMSGLPGAVQASPSFTSASAEMHSAIDPLRSLVTSTEHYMQMSSIAIGIVGVGLVIFGVLAKKSEKFYIKIQETSFEILKRRLAQGEITKNEFTSLKQDIQ